MAINTDFSFNIGEDVTLTVSMTPPVPIGGWTIHFLALNRFGGASGLINLYGASGYGGGQSGITIIDSGAGRFNLNIPSSATSGLQPKPYATQSWREDSGARSELTVGFAVLQY